MKFATILLSFLAHGLASHVYYECESFPDPSLSDKFEPQVKVTDVSKRSSVTIFNYDDVWKTNIPIKSADGNLYLRNEDFNTCTSELIKSGRCKKKDGFTLKVKKGFKTKSLIINRVLRPGEELKYPIKKAGNFCTIIYQYSDQDPTTKVSNIRSYGYLDLKSFEKLQSLILLSVIYVVIGVYIHFSSSKLLFHQRTNKKAHEKIYSFFFSLVFQTIFQAIVIHLENQGTKLRIYQLLIYYFVLSFTKFSCYLNLYKSSTYLAGDDTFKYNCFPIYFISILFVAEFCSLMDHAKVASRISEMLFLISLYSHSRKLMKSIQDFKVKLKYRNTRRLMIAAFMGSFVIHLLLTAPYNFMRGIKVVKLNNNSSIEALSYLAQNPMFLENQPSSFAEKIQCLVWPIIVLGFILIWREGYDNVTSVKSDQKDPAPDAKSKSVRESKNRNSKYVNPTSSFRSKSLPRSRAKKGRRN
ncbi:putative membrane protein [Wickerhamomyces ciferrii]|uniref:Membrane protein n=1 Tax=Wickerhamomyces ciferrii (strain ATCC 14091 / BCRC 22168 / CBS 111 / JCM 3599 / NBRC 0793 / NRRL Y-1031 F-60-10) TaxID=1206466 RepID=K0KU29_WICCF|nr:uncharacterized protein BN7_4488 [Wickerhamomyces ciferrii]CCH44919.1 putative membrane protein [Wickerhamomyces ciferrii]